MHLGVIEVGRELALVVCVPEIDAPEGDVEAHGERRVLCRRIGQCGRGEQKDSKQGCAMHEALRDRA